MANGLEVDIGLEGPATSMDANDFGTAAEVGEVHRDFTIEMAGAEEGLVKHIHSVRVGDGGDSKVSVKAVHLNEESVQRLLALVMSSTHTVSTVATDRIDLIDKDQARGILPTLFKHVTDTGSTNTDEHFDEVGTTDTEERNVRLTSDRTG